MAPEVPKRNPYVGPRPFERQDRALFFGRDREVSEILSLATAHRMLLLYAPSGAGKTSLINAGLIPMLEEEGFEVLPVARVRGRIPEDIAPEEVPNPYVLNSLISWAETEADPKPLVEMPLAGFLRERQHPTDEVGLPSPRAVIFDQFEELFTFYPERWRDREEFFKQVADALEADPLLRVVLVIREEYIAQLDPYAPLLPEKLRTRFRLERLRKEAALAAIKGPLGDTSRSFTEGVAEELVEDLMKVQAVTALGITEEVTGEFVELVQLQVVCQGLWQSLPPDVDIITQDHLQAFGDVNQALSGFYEESIKEAAKPPSVSVKDLRVWFEQHLVTLAGTRGTVYRGRERTGGVLNKAVDVLEDLHLIRGEWRAGARWYELTHDRFIEPIRESNKMWWEMKREERAKKRLIVLAALGVVVVTLLVIAFATARAIIQNRADQKTRFAKSRQLAAQALAYLDNQLDLALLLSLEAYRIDNTFDARSSLLTGLEYNPYLTTFLHGHTDAVYSVAFSPDGQTLASGSADNTIILWDVATGQSIGQPLADRTDVVYSVAFSPDGQMLASGSKDGTIVLWDIVSGQPIGHPLTSHVDAVLSVAFSPDGQMLASGSKDGTIILWDIMSGQPIGRPLTGHTDAVYSVAFSPDGQTLASGSADNTIIIWDIAASQPLGQPLTSHTAEVWSVAFSSDGQTLASGSEDNTIILWDVATGQPIGQPLTSHTAPVRSIAFSPDGQTLASGSYDDTIILWDIVSGQPIGKPLTGHKASVYSIAFSPDGQTLASGSKGKTIILWDVTARRLLGQLLTGHTAPVRSVTFSSNGRTLASGSEDNTIILWSVATGQPIGHPLTSHVDAVLSVAFSPDGQMLASGSKDGTIILWDIVSGQPIGHPLTDHTDAVLSVAFSPDGQTLASGSEDNTIILWGVATGQPIGQPLTGHTAPVRSVAFSSDGQTLASGSEDNTIILWDVATGQPIGQPFTGHTDAVLSVAFSPDGRMLASGSYSTIILRDATTGQPLGQPLISHTDWILSVAFSPDGQTLASGSEDNTIILWDVAIGQPIGQPLTDHTAPVRSVAFSPDGQTLASGSYDSTIILWDVSFESWQARICRIANRNLTKAEWNKFIGPDISYERICPDLPPGEGTPSAASPELPAIASPTSTPILATPTPTCTPIPVSMDTPTPTPTITPTPTNTPSPPGTPEHTPPPTPTPKPDAVVNVEALSLRSGPGVVYDVLEVLKRGDPLKIRGKCPDGNWLEVACPSGQKGWVAAWLLQINLPLTEVALAQVPPTPTPAHTPTPAVTPTPTPLPPPVLTSPENGASIAGWGTFRWQWDYPLKADEYFAFRVHGEGETDVCHHIPVRALEYTGGFSYCRSGEYYWGVTLIRKLCENCPEEQKWQILSQPSEERLIYYQTVDEEDEPWEPSHEPPKEPPK